MKRSGTIKIIPELILYPNHFSSLIQTILSAPESHRIMPYGSRAVPPVGNYTLPRRIYSFIKVIITYHKVLYNGVLGFFYFYLFPNPFLPEQRPIYLPFLFRHLYNRFAADSAKRFTSYVFIC